MDTNLTIKEAFDLAVQHHNKNELQDAATYYCKVLKINPNHIDSCLNLSTIVLLNKEYDTAKTLLIKVIRIDPKNVKALNNLGSLYMDTLDYPKAEFLFKKIIEINPNYLNAYFNLGKLSSKQGFYINATKFYEKVIELDSSYYFAYVLLGSDLYKLEQFEESKKKLLKAIEINPNIKDAYTKIGITLYRLGEYKEAIKVYEKSISIEPNSSENQNNLAVALMDSGEYKKAKIHFEKAITLNPNLSSAYSNLGAVQKTLNDFSNAKLNYEKAIELDPDNSGYLSNAANLYISSGDEINAVKNSHKNLRLSNKNKQFNDKISLFKLKHEVQQAKYLIANSYKINGIDEFQKIGEKILSQAENQNELKKDNNKNIKKISLEKKESDVLLPYFQESLFYVPKKFTGNCINPNKNWLDVEDEYFKSKNQIMFIDDFLSNDAIIELQKFCQISKVWDREYNNKYLGAFGEKGFISPIHLQIASELKEKLPKLFGPHKLGTLWAFKYDSTLGKGINIHADFALHNLNFWITPDEFNNNKSSGGLKVYDAPAPEYWTFRDYNQNPDKIYEFLKSTSANCKNINYKFNRAVLFNSAYFHETDEIDFKDEYVGRRINMTYLFGTRLVKKK